MTCHIAMSGGGAAAMLSDSQGSTDVSEFHGWQKQFVGPDFLLGVAGHGAILDALFDELHDRAHGPDPVTAATICDFVPTFLNDQVRYEAQREVGLILATPDANDRAIQTFEPRTFKRFGKRRSFSTIGSGAAFVHGASERDHQLGMVFNTSSLAHLLVLISYYAEAANESLTVDDKFLIGFLADNKTYLIGDRDIVPTYVPDQVTQHWSQAATSFDSIRAMLKTLNGEVVEAQRRFSKVRDGSLAMPDIFPLLAASTSIRNNLQTLAQLVADYRVWYDGILARP
jgi:hypothetical protein